MAGEEGWNTLVEEREEQMVSPTGGKPTLRIARFLKPCVNCFNEAVVAAPLASSQKLKSWPLKVLFKGWRSPQKKWKKWVEQLALLHGPLWKKTSIYDAIMASTYEIRKDSDLVLGLAKFWCSNTNTFVFPWGESTITLEDILILGGFSVLGEPVTSPLTGDLVEIKEKMSREHRSFSKQKAQKADYSAWINRFMENEMDEHLEHVAFLILWLSRYVLPAHPQDTVGKHVFSIAIHLSQGTLIALAPAVLASLYRDLRVLKDKHDSSSTDLPLSVWAPFQIMQLWAWERLPTLQPNPNTLGFGEPRAARWYKRYSNSTLGSVRLTVNSPENFQWRPYATNVNNWTHLAFYRQQEDWVFNRLNVEKELQSFERCLMACELVGLDCIEQYLPHRVAMQFGMDQDLPGNFTRANVSWKVAWRTYDKPISTVNLYVPPRLFESDVTTRYFRWWKQSMSARQDAIGDIFMQQRSLETHERSPRTSKGDKLEKHVSAPPGFPPKPFWWEFQGSTDDDDEELTLLERYKGLQDQVTVENVPASAHKPSSSTQARCTAFPVTEREMDRKKVLTKPADNTIQCNTRESMARVSRVPEEDKERNTRDSIIHPLGIHDNREETSTSRLEEPGLELEARISKLERVIAEHKANFGSKLTRKTS